MIEIDGEFMRKTEMTAMAVSKLERWLDRSLLNHVLLVENFGKKIRTPLAMRYNEAQLCAISQTPADFEDRLSYGKMKNYNQSGNIKERWFKLKFNLLFYFKFTDSGQIENKPAGVIILEGGQLNVEEHDSIPFAFSLTFLDDRDKRYIFGSKSEAAVNRWMGIIRTATYEYYRIRLVNLRQMIYDKTNNKVKRPAPPIPPRPNEIRDLLN